MSFFIYTNKFNANRVHFGPVTLNAINSGKFSRITYSTSHVTLNHAGFVLKLHSVRNVYPLLQHANNGNKYSVTYDATHPEYASNVDQLRAIEQLILDKYAMQPRAPGLRQVHSISDRLQAGHIIVHDSLFDTLSDADADADADADHDDDGISNGNGISISNEETSAYADSCSDGHHGHGTFSIAVTIYGVWETQHACGLVHKFVKQ